jgi:hypothetical protein
MFASHIRRPASRLGRIARGVALAGAIPSAAVASLVVAPAAQAEVNTTTAPYGAWNWNDCHIMVGGYLNPQRYGYGDATVSCRYAHTVTVTVQLLKNGTVVRSGVRSWGSVYRTGDVLTTPGVCGDGNATWQTVAYVSIDRWGTYRFASPVGGSYLQGSCP